MKKQQGVSLIGLLFLGAVFIAVAIVGMKTAPSVIEYFTVLKNIKAVANEGKGASVADLRRAYDRHAEIDATPSVTTADLEFEKEGNDVIISFAYSKKIPLVGNVSLLIDYSGNSAGKRSAVEE